jgi:GNAT superfamily N-acetyltransferase
VLPKYQGQGLGTQLLAFAEQEALRLGLDSIKLFTSQRFADHFEFYRRHGYCEIDRCDDDGFPRVFYSKDASRRTVAVATV